MKARFLQQNPCTQADIEHVIDPGTFILASGMQTFVRRVQVLHLRLQTMARGGHPKDAVRLYETLLAACLYKECECADPQNLLPGLFPSLFRGWIRARQAADLSPKETVLQVVQWLLCMQDDRFELSIDTAVEALDDRGYAFLIDYYLEKLQIVLQDWRASDTDTDKCPPRHVLWPADDLRAIYAARGELHAYAALTLLVGLDDNDCRRLAKMAEQQQNSDLAIEWGKRGLETEIHSSASPGSRLPVAACTDNRPSDPQHMKDRFTKIAPWRLEAHRSRYFKEVRSIWNGIVSCLDMA